MQRKSSSGDASKFVLVDSEREREHDLGTRRARIVLFVVPALLLGLSILDDLAPGHDDDDMGNSFLNETLSEPKESSKLDASSLLLGLAGSDDGFSRKSAGKAARKTSREALGKSDANAQSSTASSGKGEGRRDSSHHRTESSHHRTESSHNRRSRRGEFSIEAKKEEGHDRRRHRGRAGTREARDGREYGTRSGTREGRTAHTAAPQSASHRRTRPEYARPDRAGPED
ncbi:hypothetical protein CYMTET_41708 [Cymbomonas tetramitiformis]|uniref:Uncharacterized protein n=1 Tax=Cymbomonas tetramitiformis TaxID=36881 RepID=A0AAE0C792_9CHLO|nr:hypothetical protein CYMTET_41708 [Cymbomonas tetramitiformis]